MKTVLFVPGFRETLASRDYQSLMRAIEGKGYSVKFVPIKWQRTVLNDWVAELDQAYAKHDPNDTILAGFSYGALTAFISAVKTNPAELWLFSFSPYFSDDMPQMKKSWLNNIGQRRAEVFRRLDFVAHAARIRCKTLLVVGEVEARKYPLIGSRSEVAHRAIKQSRLVVAPDCGHDVADPAYIDTIKKSIDDIS